MEVIDDSSQQGEARWARVMVWQRYRAQRYPGWRGGAGDHNAVGGTRHQGRARELEDPGGAEGSGSLDKSKC